MFLGSKWGGGGRHALQLRNETFHGLTCSEFKGCVREIAGAGSEVFGVQMKKEKQTNCLAAHLRVRRACRSPFPAGVLLLCVPEGARAVGGGRGSRKRDNKIYFLRRPHSPRPSSLYGNRVGD